MKVHKVLCYFYLTKCSLITSFVILSRNLSQAQIESQLILIKVSWIIGITYVHSVDFTFTVKHHSPEFTDNVLQTKLCATDPSLTSTLKPHSHQQWIDEGNGISLKTFAAHPGKGPFLQLVQGVMNVRMFCMKLAMFIFYL